MIFLNKITLVPSEERPSMKQHLWLVLNCAQRFCCCCHAGHNVIQELSSGLMLSAWRISKERLMYAGGRPALAPQS